MQTKAERRESDAVQGCHWTISLLKRWLIGTHAGAVTPSTCRPISTSSLPHNRRKTSGVSRIAARVIEKLSCEPPLTMRQIVDDTRDTENSLQISRDQPELRGEVCALVASSACNFRLWG